MMASRDRASDISVNGAEQQQGDIFQNLEKLIASAVSICRLDGSVQCQIGGLITVIEELQRLLRHSFAEIKRLQENMNDQRNTVDILQNSEYEQRCTLMNLETNLDEQKDMIISLERNIEDQKHMFSNNISNLHYQVKEVQSNLETLECQLEEAEFTKEVSSHHQENGQDKTAHHESYNEDVDGASTLNNRDSFSFEGVSESNEDQVMPDIDKEADVITTSEMYTTTEEVASVTLNKENITNTNCKLDKDGGVPSASRGEFPVSPPPETPSTNASSSPTTETATSSGEERESTVRVLRSSSYSMSQSHSSKSHTRSQRASVKPQPNRSVLSLRKSSLGKSLSVINDQPKNSQKMVSVQIRKRGRPSKASTIKQLLIKNTRKSIYNMTIQKSAKQEVTPKHSRKYVSPGKGKSPPSKQTPEQSKQQPTKTQRKTPVIATKPQKNMSSDIKKKVDLIAKSSPKKTIQLQLRNSAVISNPSKMNKSKVGYSGKSKKVAVNEKASVEGEANRKSKGVNESSSSKKPVNQNLSKESPAKENTRNVGERTTTTPITSDENPMDRYIDLDFLLNANQLMSELVTDSKTEEGTLDTASDAERRHVVDLAKLYRLGVRMAAKDGEFPIALIKGRESSLPAPGQVDKLLCKMTNVMAKKHKLSSSSRPNIASPSKKKRV